MPYELLDEEPQVQQKEPESFGKKLATAATRTAARSLEAVGGLPGDILATGLGAGSYLTGGAIPSYSQVQEQLPWSPQTSTQLREATQRLSGDILEPKTKYEKLYDDFVSDLSTLALPVGGGKVKLGKAAFSALGGNLASYAAKEVGASELGQGGAKLGFILGSSLLGGRRNLTETMRNAYAAGEQAAEGKFIDATRIENALLKTEKKVLASDSPSKQFILDRIRGIGSNIQNDKIDVNSVWELKRNANEWLKEPNISKTANKYLLDFSEMLNHELLDFGKTNKDFGRNYQLGEELYKGLNSWNIIKEYLPKVVNVEKVKSETLKNLLIGSSLGTTALLKGPQTALGLFAGGYAANEGAKFLGLLANSSTARNTYAKMLSGALSKNAGLVNKELSKLDKLATKYDTQGDKYELLD